MTADQAFVLLGIVLVAVTGFFFFRPKKSAKSQPVKPSGKTKHPGSKRKKKRK